MKTDCKPNALIALAASIREEANAAIMQMLSDRGVTDILPAHGALLHVLFQHGPMQMHALAARIGRKKNTVTGLVSTLEERGYCRREPDPADARAQIVSLTPKGESLREVQNAVSEDLLRKAWSGVDADDQTRCVDTLQIVLNNLKQRGAS